MLEVYRLHKRIPHRFSLEITRLRGTGSASSTQEISMEFHTPVRTPVEAYLILRFRTNVPQPFHGDHGVIVVVRLQLSLQRCCTTTTVFEAGTSCLKDPVDLDSSTTPRTRQGRFSRWKSVDETTVQ